MLSSDNLVKLKELKVKVTKPFRRHVWSDDIGSQDVHDNVELGGKKVLVPSCHASKDIGWKES